MEKRGQSNIIGAVLLILIVLGAVVLLWMMVRNFIQPQMFDAKGDCMKVDLQFVENTVRCNLTEGVIDGNFRRKEDEVGNISVTIVAEGNVFEKGTAGITTAGLPRSPGPLETGRFSVSTGSISPALNDGQEIKVGVASVVGDNKDIICDVSDEITISCSV